MKHVMLSAATVLALLASDAAAQGSSGQDPSSQGGESLGQRIEQGAAGAAQSATGSQGAAAGGQGSNAGVLTEVLSKLHASNVATGQAAQLAHQNAGSSEVKQLASKVAGERSTLDKELLALAAVRGLDLGGGSSASGSGGSSALGALKDLKGAAFDKAFTSWLAGRSKQDAKTAQDAQAQAKQSGDSGLAALLGKVVPQLEGHAQSAKKAQPTQRQASTGAQQP